MRSLLAALNSSSNCRYTSMLRFGEAGDLVSVWTFDRLAPEADPFPLGLPVDESYCVLVRDTGQTTIVENAQKDPRVSNHPKRNDLAAYLGVPVADAGGRLFGTLCSYDPEPQLFTAEQQQEHENAAGLLAGIVSRWIGAGVRGPDENG